jgi:hypothetical protein
MKPSKALTIKKHEAQLRVYGEVQLRVYGAKYKSSVVANYAEGIIIINLNSLI